MVFESFSLLYCTLLGPFCSCSAISKTETQNKYKLIQVKNNAKAFKINEKGLICIFVLSFKHVHSRPATKRDSWQLSPLKMFSC